MWSALVVGAIAFGAIMLPIAPINSSLWKLTAQLHDNFAEQVGWTELVETVSNIYTTLPAAEQRQIRILTGNYREAGAINLLGLTYQLPPAISGVNTYWWRGYGNPPPQTLIVLGFSRTEAEQIFTTCTWAGRNSNHYGVENEESQNAPDIFLCREPHKPWPDLWRDL